MEHAKKMLLIEPSLIEKVNQCNNVDTPSSRLDTEMKNILDSKVEDRKKCILYLQILQRYLHFNEENRRPIEIPIIHQNAEFTETNINEESKTKTLVTPQTLKEEGKREVSSVQVKSNPLYTTSQILSVIPKKYLKKGELLLDFISLNKNKIQWKDNGTVIIDNNEISGSNIVDLINDFLRPLKRDDPLGWENFANALNDIKVPLAYLGNPKRIVYLNQLKTKEIEGDSANEAPSTPPNKYRNKIRKKLEWEKWTPY